MSLFPPLTAAPETSQDRLDRLVDRIRNNSRNSFNQMVEIHNEWIRMVWQHFEFTPTEVVAGLSADNAVKFFHYTQDLRTYLLSVASSEGIDSGLIYPTNQYVFSAGTVVITASAFVGP